MGADKRLRRIGSVSVLIMAITLGTVLCSSAEAQARELQVSVAGALSGPLGGVQVYAFTASGSYTGLNSVTDAQGETTFDTSAIASGMYRFRVDYLGQQFWSEDIELPVSTTLDVTLAEGTVDVTFSSAAGPVADARVYLFSETDSYLGTLQTTDTSGTVAFVLPVARSFKFRGDYLGEQYWSDVIEVSAVGSTLALIDAGGGTVELFVGKATDVPLEGVGVYLFNEEGSYLGQSQVAGSDGKAGFDVPAGRYKFRADHIGYQFWSDVIEVGTSLNYDFIIPHQDVTLTVQSSYQGQKTSLNSVPVYLYTPAGSYQGFQKTTEADGTVVFNLPEAEYSARADYLDQQFWSEPFVWTDTPIDIASAEAQVSVNWSSAFLEDVPVYVFSSSGNYLGINDVTGSDGQAVFLLPAGDYRFRADYQDSQFWSGDVNLVADQENPVSISTGGGTFLLTVQKSVGQPIEGVNCYVFSASGVYLGLLSGTSSEGTASFDLADGSYQCRIDYLGYPFWTPVFSVPDSLDLVFGIPHRQSIVSVNGVLSGDPQPRVDVPVYLFTPDGSYLSINSPTDAAGEVSFELPDKGFKVRADYLGQQFWSDPFQFEDTSVTIPEGTAEVSVTAIGQGVSEIPIYVFSAENSYLGLNAPTDTSGIADFRLPAGSYRFRADYLGSQYWGDAEIEADVVNPVAIDAGGAEFSLTVTDGTSPIEGVNVYAFNPAGSYLGMTQTTDASGQVSFGLPDGAYRFRADLLGYQFWSADFEIPTTTSGTLAIGHQEIAVTVGVDYPAAETLEGVQVYLFTPTDAYLELNEATGSEGRVVFTLPDQEYKVRADYMGFQYWSETFQSQDAAVTIPRGGIDVHVTQSGTDVAGAQVYLFNEAGSYLGINETTGSDGLATFILPVESLKFRVDVDGEQHWTPLVSPTAGRTDPFAYELSSLSVSISADPEVIAPGQNATLTWTSFGADSCSIEPGIGPVDLNGSMTVNPTSTTEYVITAALGSETVTDTATVTMTTVPSITIIEPDGVTDTADDTYTITWDDSDPDNNAVISLFYDSDSTGADGVQIATGIPEDEDGLADSFVWDTSAIPQGSYFVYAIIDDGLNPEIAHYSSGPVTVSHVQVEPDTIKLTANDAFEDDQFGAAVAITDGTALVSTTYHNYENGAAYLFEKSGAVWTQQSKFTPFDSEGVEKIPQMFLYFEIGGEGTFAHDELYVSGKELYLDMDGWLFGGSTLHMENANSASNLLIKKIEFLLEGVWVDRTSDTYWDPGSGSSASYEASVGWHLNDNSGSLKAKGSWGEDAEKIRVTFEEAVDEGVPPGFEPQEEIRFGTSIAVSGNRAIVGAPGEWVYGWSEGAAYIYEKIDDRWAQLIKLHAVADGAGVFGQAVAMGDTFAVIGIPDGGYQDSSGNAQVYSDQSGHWEFESSLYFEDFDETVLNGSPEFGCAVSASDDLMIIGANSYDDNFGAAYVLKRRGASVELQAKLVPEGQGSVTRFGRSVAINGDYAVVGDTAANDDSGLVYVFKKEGLQWTQQAILSPESGVEEEKFGSTVSIDGSHIVVGSLEIPGPFPGPVGGKAVYVFRRDGDSWIQLFRQTAPGPEPDIGFGGSASVRGDQLIAGAPFDSEAGDYAGAAYLLSFDTVLVDIRADSELTSTGEVVLSWDSKNAETCEIEPGIGLVGPNGSIPVSISEDTTFTIKASGPLGTVTDSVTININTPPSFIFTDPDGSGDLADGSFTVKWSDGDPDENASIKLYFDKNDSGADGEPIADDIGEDADEDADAYVWDTSDLSDGKYFVYAVIDDGVYDPLIVYSGSPITVVHSNEKSIGKVLGGGAVHSAAITPEGTVIAWGDNEYGQLGVDTTDLRMIPTPVPGLSSILSIACGYHHTVAVKGDGTVWAWGANDHGQLGDGTRETRISPVQVNGLSNIVEIAANSDFTLALDADGVVWAWGENSSGQLGNGSINDSLTPIRVPGLPQIKSISCGWNHAAAVADNWTVWTWGDNHFGQLGDGTDVNKLTPVQVPDFYSATAVACGDGYSIALKWNGTVWAWGANNIGQLGDGTTYGRLNPVQLTALSNINSIATKMQFSAALRSDGTIWTWGSNHRGQLGDDTRTDDPTPKPVPDFGDAVAIACGWNHMLVLKSDGTVWSWGYNLFGQLGNNSIEEQSTSPQAVMDETAAGQLTLFSSTQPPPLVFIRATPDDILAGDSITLQWNSAYASTVSISPDVGVVDSSGTTTVSPTKTTEYTIIATGPGGRVTDTVEVYVTPKPGIDFGASPGTIDAGQSAMLSWTVSEAETVSIDQGIGEVGSAGSLSVTPSQTTIYTMTATNSAGTSTSTTAVVVRQQSQTRIRYEYDAMGRIRRKIYENQ